MKKSYFIVPLVVMAAFIVYYMSYHSQVVAQQAEKARIQATARLKAAKVKYEKEEAARKAAEAREAKRKKEAEEREAKREAAHQAQMADLNKRISDDKTEAAKLTAQANQLDTNLKNERAALEAEHRKQFDMETHVERLRVKRQDAEFEVQRLTQIFANKIHAASLLTQQEGTGSAAGAASSN